MKSLTSGAADELRSKLWGSFLLFEMTFFPLVTGRPFYISAPPGRESHFVTIARELTMCARLEISSTNINVPPGYGKSTQACLWVAWTLSRWADSQYIYISYGKHVAASHTEFIRRVIMLPQYREIFDVHIRSDSRAKDSFITRQGGHVQAFGSSGPITGHNAGMPNLDRFSGALIMDDMHKPDEVHSDTIREGVIQNYRETILQRPRSPNVPAIFIGQCLHESDLPMYFRSGQDERKWKHVIIKSLDEAGNALYPEVTPLEHLLIKKEKNPYVFSSQYQQEPTPSGGSLFKENWFHILDEEPEILKTFITADTAETSKSYNDSSVFSFFGLYNIKEEGIDTGQMGLHWLDCVEIRVEPKDLEYEFKSFYGSCMLHKVKPLLAAIEKKSTGVTLLSLLEGMRGLRIQEVMRTKASGTKTDRYLEMQPVIAAKLISFTYGAKHVPMCVKHMGKITANESHRHDDICDTLYDACKIALIDKSLTFIDIDDSTSRVIKGMSRHMHERQRIQQQSAQQKSWR